MILGRSGGCVARELLGNLNVRCHIYMKSITKISVLAALLVAAYCPCLAMMSIEKVSKDRAKELGIEIRATANGPNEAWVELELKPEGHLRGFNHVSLEIRDGKTFLLGYDALKEKRTSSGSVVVGFLANRTFLEKITLCVVEGVTGDRGHELRVKDFVEMGKLR